MRVAIAPASTKTGAAIIRSLLAISSPAVQVKAYYRDLKRVPAEFSSSANFEAAQGTVEDESSLDFESCDAVLAITPPVFDGREIVPHAKQVSETVKRAIERAGCVKRLVLLSSIGADRSSGVGEIKSNNMAERVFANTNVPQIVFVRCAYFMENWTFFLDSLKDPQPYIISTITPPDWKVPMVAVDDIGSTLASELTKAAAPPSKPYVFDLQGPRMYAPRDVQQSFSKVLGKEVALKSIEKNELHAFYSKLFPPQIIDDWVEMALSFLPGGVMAVDKVDWDEVNIVRGKTEVEDVIKNVVPQYTRG